MLKRSLPLRWLRPAACLAAVLTGLAIAFPLPTHAETASPFTNMVHRSLISPVQSDFPPLELESDEMPFPQDVSTDPLGSPHPIPWDWMMKTQAEFGQKGRSGVRYYRSPSLVSPDGKYAAYTRIQLHAEPELYRSQAKSVLFVEDLQTGRLQVIRASSPIAEGLLAVEAGEEVPGILSILLPVSWSATGDRLLSRQLEGYFSTSDATDYAVVWERQSNKSVTLNPVSNENGTAVLLGWNHLNPDQVLFRAGELGQEDWFVWAMSIDGTTLLANQPESVTYGQTVTHSWTGSHALY